jgi:arylsulfatase A-like enzyme
LIHWPRRLAPSDVTRSVSTLDVLPTIADLLEIDPHPSFQGQSLLHPEEQKRAVFMNIQGMASQDGVVCFPFKLVLDRGSGKYSLFDLEHDPGESRDLFSERRQTAEALAALLRAQMRAQLAYYAPEHPEQRQATFAPDLLECPELAPSEPAVP